MTGKAARLVQAAWDREYSAGRYQGEMPVAFVDDILDAAADGMTATTPGLYVGCGNGRNYLPLVNGGLDLVGLDVSAAALDQLAAACPESTAHLVHGDLWALPEAARYPLVIGIQVFQHGDRHQAHTHLRTAAARVAPAGLLAVRVNATATDLEYDHDPLDTGPGGAFSIIYRDGPKTGLAVHFFTDTELTDLLGDSFEPVLPLRLHSTRRTPPATGQWSQWEAIWRRRAAADPNTVVEPNDEASGNSQSRN